MVLGRAMSATLPRRPFGNTGLEVSILGLGGGVIGDEHLSDHQAERVLDEALACGINLIDTARSYGASEARIGRFLRRRRDELVLSTKIGYGVPGVPDWTPECIRRGVDAARDRLGVDVIDIVHLHSCPRELLLHPGLIDALREALAAAKIRVAAYAGDNEAAEHAVSCGAFGSVLTSLNLCDQRAVETVIGPARERGLGVIAKRALANAPWRFAERPVGDEAELYWLRWKELDLDPMGLEWQELALRFAAWFPGVHSALVGTANPDHLRANAEAVARGPLPEEMAALVRGAFARRGADWPARI
jgi:aryl-alcohol dehydrogenase-like predicted oxidoreductase